MTWVFYGKLVALREDIGGYIVYVFQDLDTTEYEMCTRLPNWNEPILEIGDVGYIEIEDVYAGYSTYCDINTGEICSYKYDNNYFRSFVPEIKPKSTQLTL